MKHENTIDALYEALTESGRAWDKAGSKAALEELQAICTRLNLDTKECTAIEECTSDAMYTQNRAGFKAGFIAAMSIMLELSATT